MSIWTNWDPLSKVIVGQAYEPGSLDWCIAPEIRNQFNQILSETKEDLDNLAIFLSNRGIKVLRPEVSVYEQALQFSNFKVIPTAPIVPRDQYLVYGDTVFQTYTSMPDRYLDSLNYYKIFKSLFDEGLNWISQPPPLLNNLPSNTQWWNSGQKIYNDLSDRILWHTATFLKCGDAVIVNSEGPGTSSGLEWMRRNLPHTRFISNKNTFMNDWGHIDHGWFMIDDETVFCKTIEWVPEVLRNKNCIEIDQYIDIIKFEEYCADLKQTPGKLSPEWIEKWLTQWKGYMQETHFDTNVLVLDSKNIVFANTQPRLFDFLQARGINCHVCEQRHGMFWDAGIHCLTLDVERIGHKRKIC
jgi:hypothetical protein